jgi:hypothetical protein
LKKFIILTKFRCFHKIWWFWQNLKILTKFDGFDKIWKFRQNWTIFTKFDNCDKCLQFQHSSIRQKSWNLVPTSLYISNSMKFQLLWIELKVVKKWLNRQ